MGCSTSKHQQMRKNINQAKKPKFFTFTQASLDMHDDRKRHSDLPTPMAPNHQNDSTKVEIMKYEPSSPGFKSDYKQRKKSDLQDLNSTLNHHDKSFIYNNQNTNSTTRGSIEGKNQSKPSITQFGQISTIQGNNNNEVMRSPRDSMKQSTNSSLNGVLYSLYQYNRGNSLNFLESYNRKNSSTSNHRQRNNGQQWREQRHKFKEIFSINSEKKRSESQPIKVRDSIKPKRNINLFLKNNSIENYPKFTSLQSIQQSTLFQRRLNMSRCIKYHIVYSKSNSKTPKSIMKKKTKY